MDDFLKLEYEKCLDLLKYYDQRHTSILQFVAALSSAVATGMLAFYKDSSASTQHFWLLIFLVALVTALSQIGLFCSMVQNRLYFVFPARQVNAIRQRFLNAISPPFPENQMYLDAHFPAYKTRSVHTVIMALVAFQAGIFLAISTFSALEEVLSLYISIFVAAAVAVVSPFLMMVIAADYLTTRSSGSADQAIHRP